MGMGGEERARGVQMGASVQMGVSVQTGVSVQMGGEGVGMRQWGGRGGPMG